MIDSTNRSSRRDRRHRLLLTTRQTTQIAPHEETRHRKNRDQRFALATGAFLFSVIASCSAVERRGESSLGIQDQSGSQAFQSISSMEKISSDKSVCPDDMVEVKGMFCPDVDQTCINLDKTLKNVNGYPRCLEFAPTKCLSSAKQLRGMDFCIDIYEASDKKGELPPVMKSWEDGKIACEKQGKRLCVDNEWTLACEGPEILPYPYGLKRDATACNIDHDQRPWFDASKMPMTPEIVAKLDQRVPSGSMPGCVSPFGVFDMTGNVDEAVINSSGHPYKSSLTGGHWVRGARNRCRPKTIVHGPTFANYESSYRCCKDTE